MKTAEVSKLVILFTVSCVLFFCSGCTSSEPIETGLHVDKSWVRNLINNCSSVSGEYKSIGETSIVGAAYKNNPRLESGIFGIDGFENLPSIVVIKQMPNLTLNVVVKDNKNNVLTTRNFDTPYTCDIPWITYESHVEGSGDGSSVIGTYTVTKLARSDDQSLIVLSQVTTESRSWFVSRKKTKSEVLYRFTANIGTE